MSNCDEALAELRQLLAQAQGPVLLPDDAARIRKRADEIASACPSAASAELCARTHDAVARAAASADGNGKRRPASAPSPRLAVLERALGGHGPMPVSVLRRALREGGFHGGEELPAADGLHFQWVMAGALPRLEALYRGLGDDVAAARLNEAREELDELAGLVPARMEPVDASIGGLREFVVRRAADAEARARLQALIPTLETLLRDDDPAPARIQAAREGLEGNPWAAQHPDDAEARQAVALLDRLHDRRTVCDELRRLSAEVSQALSARPDQVGEAARRVEDVYGRARGHALADGEPLRRAAERVMDAADERLREIAALPRDVQGLRRVVGEAASLSDALRLLPASLAPEAAARVCACDEVAREAEARIESIVLAQVAAELAELPPEDVPACAARLAAGEHPVARREGERLARLHAAAGELESLGDTLDDLALDRLRADAGEVPAGPFRDWLRAALAACRDARAELDAVHDAMQGDAAVEPLRARVDVLGERFPAWARVARAREGLDDLALMRRVRACAAGADGGLSEARQLAASLAVPARRERVVAALERLGDVRRELPRLRRALAAGGAGERQVDRVVTAARTLSALVLPPHADTLREEFPDPWNELDAEVSQALLHDVPAALRDWVQQAATAAASVGTLERAETAFARWARELGAAFPVFVQSHGRQLLHTRRVELRMAPMLAEGRYDDARRLLAEAVARLPPETLARQRRRVESGAAVAAYRRDGAAALEGVVQAVLHHGADGDLVDVLLEAFATTGATAALAAVAGPGDGPLAGYPGLAQLARWCMLFQRGLLDELVAEVGSVEATPANLDEFVSALARSDRHGQAAYVLQALRRRDGCGAEEAARLQKAIADVCQGLEQAHRALAAHLNALETALDEDPGPLPDAAPSLSDVRAAADAAARETDAALAAVVAWQEAVNETLRWLPRGLATPRTDSVLQRLRALRGRLMAGREMVAEILDAATGARTVNLDRWTELQDRFGRGGRPVARLQAAQRLVHAYVRDWHFIADAVRRLAGWHSTGGVGVTPEKLDSELRRLETYRYDFQADRFHLLPLLPEGGFDSFVTTLQAQVAEVAQVTVWLRQSRAVMAGILDPLRARMERWHGFENGRKPLEAARICALLGARRDETPSAAELFARLPAPLLSSAAREMMWTATEDPWFTLLKAAVAICQDEREDTGL
jgi:hypothetical protein